MVGAMANSLLIQESTVKVRELQEQIWHSWVVAIHSGSGNNAGESGSAPNEAFLQLLVRSKAIEVGSHGYCCCCYHRAMSRHECADDVMIAARRPASSVRFR